MKKLLVGLLISALALTSVPVFAAEEVVVLSENAMPEEAIVEVAEPEVVLTVDEPETDSFEPMPEEVFEPEMVESVALASASPDTSLVESFSLEMEAFGAGNVKYYSQPAYKVKSGYDIIASYIQATDGSYPSRLFFVYDKEYGEWLRYDYSVEEATEFLGEWETKDSSGTTLYIPVAKTKDGKTVAHADIDGTALDESKIPVIKAADVSGINYAWKALSDIPFVKDGSSYVYATADSTPTPTPTPAPIVEPGKYEATIGKNVYTIEYTTFVTYDGRAHGWEKTNLSSKTLKTKVNDLSISVYRNGTLLAPGDISIKYKNNTNITGFAGKNAQPYFTVGLKGKKYEKESKKLSKVKMKFDIVPCTAETGTFQAKKVVVSGDSVSFSNLYFVFADGRKVALKKKTSKEPGGSYTAEKLSDGSIQINGCNNLSGSGKLSMENPKKTTYEW